MGSGVGVDVGGGVCVAVGVVDDPLLVEQAVGMNIAMNRRGNTFFKGNILNSI